MILGRHTLSRQEEEDNRSISDHIERLLDRNGGHCVDKVIYVDFSDMTDIKTYAYDISIQVTLTPQYKK